MVLSSMYRTLLEKDTPEEYKPYQELLLLRRKKSRMKSKFLVMISTMSVSHVHSSINVSRLEIKISGNS
jgi:hypothetical protein